MDTLDFEFEYIRTNQIEYNYEYILTRDYCFPEKVNFLYYFNRIKTKDYITIDDDMNLYVFTNYFWDGFYPYFLQKKKTVRASLFRHVMYDLIKKGKIPYFHKKEVDKIILEILKKDKVNPIQIFFIVFLNKIEDLFRQL